MYELSQEYGLKDLSPASFRRLSEMIKTDENIANKYIANTLTQSKPSEGKKCDKKCQHNNFCKTSNFFNFERQDCAGKERIDFKNSLKSSLYESFFSPWIEKVE